MGNIWDQVKQGTIPTNKEAASAWDNIKQPRISQADLLAPSLHKEPTVIKADNHLPVGTISLDLETGSVTEMFRTGPEFLRLSGYSTDLGTVLTTTDHMAVVKAIQESDGWVVGHNILNYDLILLAKHCGLNILDLAKKNRIIDTKLLAFLADPPVSRTSEGEIERMFSLDNTGLRYLGEGKVKDIVSGKSVLKELAKEFDGFDKIPQDHPQYIEYLKQDVIVTRDLAKIIPMSDYTSREHKINAIASVISIQGFRVDVSLLEQRIKEGEEKKHRILTELMDYGLPGPETTKAPHRTKAGVAAIDTAFSGLGVTLPRTEKTGRPALGKEVLLSVIEGSNDQNVIDLAESVLSLNGIRTIYANIHEYLVGDRVHPAINLRQSTGRWSVTKPGLTVVGKRGGKVVERAVFLSDSEDHVLISCDLSQVDARAVAALSQDVEYLKLFEPGRDLHTEMALKLFGTETARERAKNVTHAVNYSVGARKLAFMTGMMEQEASDVLFEIGRNFPRLIEWQHEVRTVGETTGVLYNGYGRLMRIEPERAFTQSPALLGQSTARDILMEGLLRIWEIGGEDVVKMVRAVVHDEAVLSVPIKDVEEIEQLVVKAMSFEWCPVGGEYPVSIIAGLGSRGRDWSRCYDK